MSDLFSLELVFHESNLTLFGYSQLSKSINVYCSLSSLVGPGVQVPVKSSLSQVSQGH